MNENKRMSQHFKIDKIISPVDVTLFDVMIQKLKPKCH